MTDATVETTEQPTETTSAPAAAPSGVRAELCAIAGIDQKENETWPKFADRMVRTIDKKEISEEDWAKLSPEAQEWFNSAVESISSKVPIRTFPGEEPTAATAGKGKTKAAKAPKEPREGGNGRPKKLADEGKITLLLDKNPQREGSMGAAMYDKYKNGMTVKEAMDAGVTRSHLNWSVDHGWIKVE